MKHLLLFATVATLGGGVAAAAGRQWSYSPNDMKVLGTLDNGQTSKPVTYASTPKYRAFVFEGNGRDQVEVTVTGGTSRKAYVALADSTLTPIASGIGRVAVTLPYHGPDIEAFYILVKDLSNQPGQLAVHLKKVPGSAPTAAGSARSTVATR